MHPDEILQMAEDRFERRLNEETGALRHEMASMRQEMREGFAGLRIEMAGMRTDMAESKADIFKWMFAFWTGQCFAILGFVFLILRNR